MKDPFCRTKVKHRWSYSSRLCSEREKPLAPFVPKLYTFDFRACAQRSKHYEAFVMSIRLTVFAVATIGLLALVQPVRADITFKSQDGTLEITLPNGWHEAKQGGPEVKIHVAGQGTRVTVRAHPKEDFKDIKSVANFLAERLKKRFTDAEPKFEDVQVKGKPAIRVILEGTEPSGVKVGYLITVIDAGSMYVSVVGTGNASAFARQKPVLEDLANQLKVTAANDSSSAPPPPPATKPRR
jgi:hypothetical protein